MNSGPDRTSRQDADGASMPFWKVGLIFLLAVAIVSVSEIGLFYLGAPTLFGFLVSSGVLFIAAAFQRPVWLYQAFRRLSFFPLLQSSIVRPVFFVLGAVAIVLGFLRR